MPTNNKILLGGKVSDASHSWIDFMANHKRSLDHHLNDGEAVAEWINFCIYALWVTKHVTGFCGTNRQLHCRRKVQVDALCPHEGCRARGVKESMMHILTCPAPEQHEAFCESVNTLDQWMEQVDTAPAL